MNYWTAQAKNGSVIIQKIIGLVIYDLSRRQGDVWLTQFGLLNVPFPVLS